jgi:hypothetical protein
MRHWIAVNFGKALTIDRYKYRRPHVAFWGFMLILSGQVGKNRINFLQCCYHRFYPLRVFYRASWNDDIW